MSNLCEPSNLKYVKVRGFHFTFTVYFLPSLPSGLPWPSAYSGLGGAVCLCGAAEAIAAVCASVPTQ